MQTAESLLEAARKLTPEIIALRDDIDRERRLPALLADRLREEGLFQLWLPRAFSGPELHPAEYLSVIEALSMADGAVGWCATNAGAFSLFAGSLPEASAHSWRWPQPKLLWDLLRPSATKLWHSFTWPAPRL